MKLRLLTYNIRYGGSGREPSLSAVIGEAAPDLVILQEATRPDVVERLARATGMRSWAAAASHSVAYMSRVPIAHHAWHRPPPCRRAFLEVVPADGPWRVFGVHLSAVHSNWRERRRARELRALLTGIERHQHGPHLLAGDFNTLAPGEKLDIRRLPPRLQWVVWLTGRRIRWQTIQMMLDASYVDAFRSLHPSEPGFTFPTWDPHVRLDFVFVPEPSSPRVRQCQVVNHSAAARQASDHLPLVAELDLA